ncbi:MAG: manganese efflux pump MntP family protein [Oscillospiraceae bacterium]|nr:manganese efflux pump MntP family protein [Oscillospiraceae bacterium]
MHFLELLLIAVGLSMDAFAVSVCKGLSVRRLQPRHALLAGLYFGGFQFLMPVIGWLLGVRFQTLIENLDHWIAFGLLAVIGASMIREAFQKEEELNDDFGFKTMLLLAVATSIDALAVGVTFAFLQVRILPAAGLIGVTTFLLSAVGIKVGAVFGARWKSGAEIAGGCILILIGLKILLEHLGIVEFPF